MIAVEIVLHYFHRLKLLDAGFLGNLVFAVVGVVFEVPDVGDVTDITHLVAEMLQVALDDVKGYGRTGMSEVSVAIDRRPAHIHSDRTFMERFECFFIA